jgi:hypothetical protein
MTLVIFFGLVMVVFWAILLNLFFQLWRIESQINQSLETVEIYLLHEFGEIKEKDLVVEIFDEEEVKQAHNRG